MLYDKIKKIGLPVILGVTAVCLLVSVLVYKGTRYVILENGKEIKSDKSYFEKGLKGETVVELQNTILEEEIAYIKRKKGLRRERKKARAKQERVNENTRKAQAAEGYIYTKLTEQEIRYNKLVEQKKRLDELRDDKREYLEAKKVGETNGVLKTGYVLVGIAVLLAFLVFPVLQVVEQIKEKNFKPLITFGVGLGVIGVLYFIGYKTTEINEGTLEALSIKLNWQEPLENLEGALFQTNELLVVTYVLLGISLLGIVVGEVLRLVKN